MYFKTSK